jgi:hypothetical protein
MKLNIGGEVTTGDVVGIAYNNCIEFGFYVEEGQYGSLKFITFDQILRMKDHYEGHISGTSKANDWLAKRFAKGLTFKSFMKDYVLKFGKVDNRAFKIVDPSIFFQGSDLKEKHIKVREIMKSVNFPAK